MNARETLREMAFTLATGTGPIVEPESFNAALDVYRLAIIADRDAQTIEFLEKKAREEGASNKERRTRANVLFRMADKISRGAIRPPLSKGPDPLIVSRFDVAMEPAPEEEQVLTVGCIDENGRPVALLLDMEARSKVARWLAPELNDTGRAANP